MHVMLQIRQEIGMARVVPEPAAAPPAVAEVLNATLWTGVQSVVLDLRDVPTVTAPLAVAIARAARRIQRQGAELVVVRTPTDADRHDLLTLADACRVVSDLPSSGWRERSEDPGADRRYLSSG